MDGLGIVSASLTQILESWPQGKKYPKYLYTVPYGCNPTGGHRHSGEEKRSAWVSEEVQFSHFGR